jgi:hypothetical protein
MEETCSFRVNSVTLPCHQDPVASHLCFALFCILMSPLKIVSGSQRFKVLHADIASSSEEECIILEEIFPRIL